ncbi:hypothetical protein [Parerythrobacter jejuensis]|uniref:Uncharacterized protein n=1 Tax=Parerythrobacter jejuensis TaxID=795812 RepID=A0A845ASL9_9SPHN|nr:hypothetical protein [Parerythrobacter jejuensis]MXP31506.1 hypothetical protein [Parerythrobacter jejuensis]
MSEASFASLNPSLLARKGGAKPAMRPQLTPLEPGPAESHDHLEDLGWNDMGEEAPAPRQSEADVLHLTPEPANEAAEQEARQLARAADEALAQATRPEVHRQREELAERVVATDQTKATPEPAQERKPKTRKRRSALERGKRAAFTLRLDADRHLKLRLACTVKGRSAQQIVTEALDGLLDDMPDIDSLAAQVQRH